MKSTNPFAFRPGPVSFWTTVVYLAIAIPLLYVHETVPPAPSDHSLYRGLNLTEAWLDLETISSAYHPYNSHENDLVRDFLVNRSKEILAKNEVDWKVDGASRMSPDGLFQTFARAEFDSMEEGSKPPRVTLFDDQTANVTWTSNTRQTVGSNIGQAVDKGQYFEGNNFYIYIHGTDDPEGDWWLSESEYRKTHGKGGVLVNCHFDSVATGFGATDDGMSCVSMLQMLSYFTSAGKQPRNGIVLLFNNAEEDGLYGARAFIQSPLLNFCHTFVNLEGAGAGGRAILFRTTDLETAKIYGGSPHPFGTVVAANAFERGVIKSGTDYEIFSGYFGQRGMDIAFYAPRSRYHTEEDDTRHSSINSIWHMLSAALTSTERLSATTGTNFHGPRSDGDRDLVQNGKRTEGVWFDIFGVVWAAFALKGLFAWSLTLLVASPLIAFTTAYILIRQDKLYFFSRELRVHSDLDDDPIKLKGWRGFFRFPLALIFAGGLTIASALLVAKINPFIVYSSSYAVFAMTISLFYFVFWLLVRGASLIRPSALHRGFVTLWLFFLGWIFQVFAAVGEDRLHIGGVYSSVFLQSAVFLAVMVSLLEHFALLGKQEYAQQLHDAHHARDVPESHDESTQADASDSEEDQEDEPSETTPLRPGDNDYGSNDQPTFASAYRRSVSEEPPKPAKVKDAQPYDGEQGWSGRLPTWTWFFQLLLLAPIPLILIGNLALVAMSSTNMTGTDGGSRLMPLLNIALLSIVMLLPITPFLHRVTHHIPLFLLLVFVGSFTYNLAAFPFSNNHRMKFSFQQIINLDDHTNTVVLTGIEEHIRQVIRSVPAAAGQNVNCRPTVGRDLMDCSYDASSSPPHLVSGNKTEDLLNVETSLSSDGSSAQVTLHALDTRMCYLDFNKPIFDFSVEGGSARDPRYGAFPADGIQELQLWRRDRNRAWKLHVQLTEAGGSSVETNPPVREINGIDEVGELKTRAVAVNNAGGALEVRVRCGWSDANEPHIIPAFRELRQYMPTWAVATKRNVGLVEVWKTYEI